MKRNHRFLYEAGLTKSTVLVFLYMEDHMNIKHECFPSYRTMAKEMNLSKNTVVRSVKALEKINLIQKVKRKRKNGGNTSNLYKLNFKGVNHHGKS